MSALDDLTAARLRVVEAQAVLEEALAAYRLSARVRARRAGWLVDNPIEADEPDASAPRTRERGGAQLVVELAVIHPGNLPEIVLRVKAEGATS